jgi:class 3 adenylate cyclase
MLCPGCHTNNLPAMNFCGKCGARLGNRCVRCGFDNPSEFAFCGRCGSSLAETVPAGQTNRQPPASHSDKPELSTIEATEDPEGERKMVTALFADIKGSTQLVEDLDPEDARAIIDPALRLMSNAVHRYDGYVVQSTGDGIFALFGAPVAHEEHPRLALHAALAMQDAIRQYAARLASEGRATIEARVGVNTGEVVLRTLHTTSHTEYVPVGLTAHLAQRMEAVASAGAIAVSENTAGLVQGYFHLKAMGPVRVKGVSQPINVFVVVGVGPLRTHFELSAQRGLTKFVGREREIAEMARALELSRNGQGQIVAAVAEAGTGKSRLFHEFKSMVDSGCIMLEVYSVSHGKASAYQPVLELLNNYFGIEGSDVRELRRKKVRTKIAALDPSLGQILPYLWALLGLQDVPDPLALMDGPIKRRRTLEALKQIFLRESIRQPVIIVFEDLHWVDEESQAFLNLIADSIANARIMLLVNYRPEYRHEWSGKSYYTQLRLNPLAKESAEELLSALLGAGPELQQLRRLIIEKTAGNPFFMEEMVQALLEQGALVRNGAMKLRQPLTDLKIPPTVQRILASRIDRLPAEEKEMLQILAVVGREFSLSLIKTLVGRRPPKAEAVRRATGDISDRLERILSNLQLGEFIFELPALHDVQYRFKHALTQEVAYASVLTESRKALHELTAETISALYADRIDDHLTELAHHYSRSDNIVKAINYLYFAGRQAAGRSAHREALAYFADGMQLLGGLQQGDRIQLELLLQIGSGFSLRATKGFTAAEVEQALERARKLCTHAKDSAQLFDVLVGLHTYYLFGPRLETSRELAKNLIAVAEGLGETTKIDTSHVAMGQTTTFLGEFHSARGNLEQALELGAGNAAVEHNAIGYLAPTLWSLGYPDQAERRMREALAFSQESKRPLLTANVLAYGAVLFLRMQLWKASRKQAAAGRDLANQHGFRFHTHCFAVLHGRALTEDGDLEQGIAEMRQGIVGLEELGAARPFLLGYLAEGCLKAGLIEEGLQVVSRATRRTEETDERWTWSDLHRLKGELLLMETSSRTAEAELLFRTAIDIAHKQGAKSYELRAAICLARLLVRQGHRGEARRILSEVYHWFTEGFRTAELRDAKALLGELSD